ncbi:MAG: SusC/RagA family TonB-linked outer membrane protein [Candidatus Cryptobacteroides sp.]
MNNHFRFALSVLVLMLSGLVAFAQQKISGTVVDAKGLPVIGAGVVEAGNPSNGAVTSVDGTFVLTVSSKATLEVSCIGYKEVSVTLAEGQKELSVVLEEDALFLDDAVVIGYQTVKRRDLTGSVSSVTGSDIAKVPVATIAQALQGKLAGVNVMSQDGRPGGSSTIRVRGGGSISQSNDPLFIVDGVQVSNIDDIPADNIESIDVLKDAASTAIYGARGANGVILVTTKSGKEGKATVRYGAYYQYKAIPEVLPVMDAYDYVLWNWSYATAYGKTYGDGVAQYFGLGSQYGNNLAKYADMTAHNYINDVNKPSGSWNHDISLSGGTADTKYFVSLNYLDDNGTRINSGFRRFGANAKLSQKIGKKLIFDMDLRYSQSTIRGNRFDMATSAFAYRPIDTPLGDDNPTHFGNGNSSVEEIYNPVDIINNFENINDRYRIRANAGLTWNILKGLTAKSELGLNRNWSETKYWDNGHPSGKGYKQAKLTKGAGQGMRWTTTLNYNVPFSNKDHNLNILAGNEMLSSSSGTTSITGNYYPEAFTMDQAFGMLDMTGVNSSGAKEDTFSNKYDIPTHTLSWFGRVNYSYKGRYLFSASLRADGSSKFGPNNHWGYFPAASAAWRISDEPFMSDTKSWMDDLKVRFSYGASGSDNINPSLWKETWKTEIITIDGVKYTSYVPGDMLSNPDLKWETTVSRNLGLDFSFLKSRIRGSVDMYWNSTQDILMKIPCDPSSGYSYQFQNVGKTSNRGVEISLAGEIVSKKDFSLSANLTYAYNQNMIDELPDSINADSHTNWGSTMRKPQYDYIIREGMPLGIVSGYVSEGFYTLDDFDFVGGKYVLKAGIPDFKGSVVNYPEGTKALVPEGQTAFPGAAKFKDVNGNGYIDDDDVDVIGEMIPKHTGGFNIFGNYRGLDFTLGFTYALGGKVYNANAMHSMMGNKDNQLGENRLAYVNDCWKAYNVDANGDLYLVTDPTELATLNAGAKYAIPYSEYGICSSEFIEDGSYLRLHTLTLGYTFPRKWMEKVGVSNLRVYATAGNLFCLSRYSGLDPDVNVDLDAGGDGFPTPYYDYNSYPKARSITFGLNVSF